MLIGPDGIGPREAPQPKPLPASPAAPAATVEPSSPATSTSVTSSRQPPDSVSLPHCTLPNENQSASPAAPQPTEGSTGAKIRRILDSDPGWSTILATAHAAYTAPNDIVSSFEDAARSNKNVATTIDHLAANWSKMSAAEHASAATDFVTLGEHTPGVSRAAGVISAANAQPARFAETLTAWSHGNGVQRLAAGVGESGPGKWLFNHSINALAPEAKEQLATISSHYSSVAEQQLAQAAAKGGKLPFLHTLSTKVGEEAGKLDNPVAKTLADVPVLKDIPVAGAIITTASAAFDIGIDRENPIAAVSKEYGGLGASQLAYNTTVRAFSSGASTAGSTGADVAADVATGAAEDGALGAGAELAGDAIAAGGPGAWAVAAGVGAAVAVGFAATKFIEGGAHDFEDAVTQGGGEIVSGVIHGNVGEVGTGFVDGVTDVGKGVVHGGEAVAQGFKSVGSAIGSLF